MKREMDMVIGFNLLPAEEWMFSDSNTPITLGPASRLTAKQLSLLPHDQIQGILADASAEAYSSDMTATDDPKLSTTLFNISKGGKGYQSIP